MPEALDRPTATPLYRTAPAYRIASDAEALAVATRIAAILAEDAVARDRERRLPAPELDLYSQSGLWAIRLPNAAGGAEVSFATSAEVFARIAEADPSIAQIAQSHTGVIHYLARAGTAAQQNFFFDEIRRGARFGNASAEFGRTFETRLRREHGVWRLSGRKFYATGALLAHYVSVAALDDDGQRYAVFLDRDTPGVSIIDDWSGFGQRTTASGTVTIDPISVPEERIIPVHDHLDEAPFGAIAQLTHVAIDIGIARAALKDAVRFVQTEARPARDTGITDAGRDPYTIQTVGDLTIRLHAAEALMERAGRILDRAWAETTPESIAEASIAVAEAKVLGVEIALATTNKFFELAGTRATIAPHAFDRHWRNARTHTVHDATRWKVAAVGDYVLNGVKPILGGQI